MLDSEILVGPYQIAFDITNRCNLGCLHCYNNSGKNNKIIKDELSDEEVINLITDISKMKIYGICFCGGEPLLRSELIIKCAKILNDSDIKVSIVSNGILLTKELAVKLKKAGVHRIQISLDGSNPCTHDKLRNKKDAFLSAINALKILEHVNLIHMVAFTPTSFNIDDFEDVYEIVKKFNVFDLRVQPLMLMGRAADNIKNIMPSQRQYRSLLKKIYLINKENNNTIISWGDPLRHLFEYRLVNDECTTFFSIRSNGDIVVSPYIPLVVGNIRRYKFSKYWDNGLANVWSKKIPKKMAENIIALADTNKNFGKISKLYNDEDLYVDLIDNDLDDISNL